MVKNNVKKKSLFSRVDVAIVTIIVAIALVTRLYKIDNNISEWHSWRQADTAAVARNFLSDFNLLAPRYDDLSNIQSGHFNPKGLRLVEFPIYNAAMASAYKLAPIIPLETYGRLVSIFFSILLLITLYYLALKEINRVAAASAAFVLAVFPFFVFYSRAILPEMTAVSLIFLSILLLYLFVHENTKKPLLSLTLLILSGVFASLALLVKPTVIFYFLVLGFLLIKKFGIKTLTHPIPYLYFLFSLVPFVLWRLWILQFPEGIPVSDWLIFSVNTPQGLQRIFMRPAFFRWVFQERILNLILGGYMAAFLIAGILKRRQKSALLYTIGISSLLYLLTFQGGNVQHDYYQVIILPALALFVGAGIASFVAKRSIVTTTVLVTPVVVAIFGLSFMFSYYRVRDYYHTNADLATIAKIVKTVTRPEDRIVTDSDGDTTLLYLSERKGYPAVVDTLQTLSKKGMSYFVTQKGDIAKKVALEFETVFSSEKVYIFKL